AAEFEERNRLLYVALTRARDRLYIAGAEPRTKLSDKSWYALVREALQGIGTTHKDAEGREIIRLEAGQTAPAEKAKPPGAEVLKSEPWPEWALRPAPREPGLSVPLAPSQLAPLETDEEGDAAPPPRDRASEPDPLPPAGPVTWHAFCAER
ncbi:MAG: hypothetical protein RL291_1555, partial [Pseudomonadota bacterium]